MGWGLNGGKDAGEKGKTEVPGEEAAQFSWKQEGESVLRLTKLGMRGVSHKTVSGPPPHTHCW